MPATIVQQRSGDTGAGTPASTNATLPAGTTLGNTLILVVTCDATVTTPAGFTKDREQVNNAGHYTYRRSGVPAGETSWTITPTSPAATCWWIAEISGLDATPLDQTISQGTSGQGLTWSTGTTGTTSQADELAIASWSTSVAAGNAITTDAYTGGFVEQADRQTTKGSGANVGLAVATRTLAAVGTYETTATFSGQVARTGMLVTYEIAAVGAPPVDADWDLGAPTSRWATRHPRGRWAARDPGSRWTTASPRT